MRIDEVRSFLDQNGLQAISFETRVNEGVILLGFSLQGRHHAIASKHDNFPTGIIKAVCEKLECAAQAS